MPNLFNLDSPPWMLDAVCSTIDPELFFVDKGGNAGPARAICADCPVATQCLEYAITSEEPLYGIWGGTTERDRRPLRSARGIGYTERKKCRNDHAYTEENTGYDNNGHRLCKTCASAAQKRRRIGAVA